MRRGRLHYSTAEMEWLEDNRLLVISDYHAGFVNAFGRVDVSAAHLHSLRKRKGWKVGRAPGRTAGRHRSYSAEEIAWLKANCTLVIADYRAAFALAFGREVSAQNLNALRKRVGWKTGRTGHFARGGVSHNKGKPCPPGVGGHHPNAKRTQFRCGEEPHNTKYLGHERVNKDGYVEVSVAQVNPHTGYTRRYVHKHRYLWESANGPVPNGHVLKCLDGDKGNCDPSNWEAIPQALLPRLAGGPRKRHVSYDAAPAELKPTILAVAKLDHRVRQARKAGSK